mgnify:CR=1 FL=1
MARLWGAGPHAGEPLDGVDDALAKALAIDPNHLKALALAGTAEMRFGNKDASIRHWEKIKSLLPKDSDDFRQVEAIIVEVRTGKPVGDDLLAGKPTVLLALAEKRFSPSLRLKLRRVGREAVTPDEAAELSDELQRSGVIDEVEQLIAAAVRAAERALASPLVDRRAADGLRRLVAQLAWRDA